MKPCSHPATLPRHPATRFKDKSERSVLHLPCTHFVELCYSLGFGTTTVSGESWDNVDFLVVAPLQPVVIQFAHALFTVLQSCSRVCPVLYLSSPILTTLSTLHKCNTHILVKLSRSHWPSGLSRTMYPINPTHCCPIQRLWGIASASASRSGTFCLRHSWSVCESKHKVSSVTYRVPPLQLKHISCCQLNVRLRNLTSASWPRPTRPSILALNSSFMTRSGRSSSTSLPSAMKSSPWHPHVPAGSRWWKNPRITLLELNPCVLSTLMYCRCHRFEAIRVPWSAFKSTFIQQAVLGNNQHDLIYARVHERCHDVVEH